MTPTVEFCPNWASAPGDTISDILEERGWSINEFAARLDDTIDQARQLLQGRATITVRTARRLEQVLGGTAEFWMARDFQFREDVDRIHRLDQEWLTELPLGDMIRYGWLQPTPRPAEEVEACLRFFGSSSVAAWRQAYSGIQALVAFRTSRAFDSHPASVAAWLRKGEIESEKIKCSPWNADCFRNSLSDIRRLTLKKDPAHFLPELQRRCSESGVALSIVRAPNGCRASGATKFLSDDKALLLFSFRYLSDDQFWFTFFHEAGHLLLHGRDSLFLEGLDAESEVKEREANEFAERILIPDQWRGSFGALRAETRAIIRFAQQVGISPGIVVGQLQHYERIPRNHFNGLKRRFQWAEG
jgi:HTH-type transcriptional regulator / antitoxin HigA